MEYPMYISSYEKHKLQYIINTIESFKSMIYYVYKRSLKILVNNDLLMN